MDLLTVVAVTGAILVHLAIILSILTGERRQASATLAWIMSIVLLPFAGALAWALIGRTRSQRIVRHFRTMSSRLQSMISPWSLLAYGDLRATGDARSIAVLQLGEVFKGSRSSHGNLVEMLVDAEMTYASMVQSLNDARSQVHVQFYIIKPDFTGVGLRDVLCELARRGVEIRVLYDAVGSSDLPDDFWAPLIRTGGHAAVYAPVSILTSTMRRRDRVDFRNHRKIVVVDGCVGFTGGINVGREYLGLAPEIGHWRDTHIRIEGPAVLGLQEVFATDWMGATGESIDADLWFPKPCADSEGCLVQTIASGPDSEWSPVEQIYVQSIALARERLWLVTPYFVPSSPLEMGLVNAALRGVDVRLLVPEKSDSRLLSLASEGYYEALLKAGVRIYLYQRGFLHAKTMVIDSWLGTIGSANLDMRSFRLNFELNAFVFDPAFCDSMAARFDHDLSSAHELTLAEVLDCSGVRKLGQRSAQLLSPLL